jgi:hypothetical protein
MNIDKKSLVTGLILIFIGIAFLSDNLGIIYISWDTFWPWFLIAGGILFFLGWLGDREKYGLLMPASILTIYGSLFLYSSYNHWWQMQNLWPVFLLGPGVGFLLMYFLGKRESGLLVPGGILLGLGVIFLIGEGRWRFFWPLLLILFGILLLLRGRLTKQPKGEIQSANKSKQEPEKENDSENNLGEKNPEK